MAQVGCPDRRIDRLCITCCSPSQPSHHAMVLGAISSDPKRGWIIISLAPSHHCPGHSGELVGKRDGGDFGRPSCQQRCNPGPILGAVDFGIANDGECAGHEQAAQISDPPCLLILPSLSRPPLECCLGTSPIQAEKLRPDRKVLGSATLATRAVAERTDAWDAIKALARLIGAVPCHNHSIKIQDLLFETEQLAAQCGKTCADNIGYPFVARIGDDPQ